MRVAFVSNYINHHQIPFCNAMYQILNGGFTFVQTEPMEEERVRMGWHAAERPSYVRCFYEEEAYCEKLILDCDIVLFGGTDEESYITGRLRAGRPVIRISERLYKTGQWKAVSPRGLKKKYLDHTRYRKAPVYLLCAGAYVPSDFHIVRAYPDKMYCWGYFPETKKYDIEELLRGKGFEREGVPHFLWAARMIDWKHPELAVETARHLKEKGIPFHMDMIGDGQLRPQMEALADRYGLKGMVGFPGYKPPEQVREYMEKADVFLFTSDRQEGWGAVANEAMNSGCAVIGNHMIGAVPFLIRNGQNGCIYEDKKSEQLFALAERLAKDGGLTERLGRNAYQTITQVWNAEFAAEKLMEFMLGVLGESGEGKEYGAGETMPFGEKEGTGRPEGRGGENELAQNTGGMMEKAGFAGKAEGTDLWPCAPAPILSEYRGRRLAAGLEHG